MAGLIDAVADQLFQMARVVDVRGHGHIVFVRGGDDGLKLLGRHALFIGIDADLHLRIAKRGLVFDLRRGFLRRFHHDAHVARWPHAIAAGHIQIFAAGNEIRSPARGVRFIDQGLKLHLAGGGEHSLLAHGGDAMLRPGGQKVDIIAAGAGHMNMGIDHAGHKCAAGKIDLAVAGEILADGGDHAVFHQHIQHLPVIVAVQQLCPAQNDAALRLAARFTGRHCAAAKRKRQKQA